jgi:hypothetical protein
MVPAKCEVHHIKNLMVDLEERVDRLERPRPAAEMKRTIEMADLTAGDPRGQRWSEAVSSAPRRERSHSPQTRCEFGRRSGVEKLNAVRPQPLDQPRVARRPKLLRGA